MQFPQPLHEGTLLKRYKRFLADIKLKDGRVITAHCANPGSMLAIAVEGAPVWVSEHRNTKRKLLYSWELIDLNGTLVPINTSNPNKIVAEALDQGEITELSGYRGIRREVKYGEASRIDFLLTGGRRRKPCYLEVKNVHLMRTPGLAEFPDSVTARGRKHLHELSEMAQNGARAVMLFIVQRSDCTRFRPAADIDPAYNDALMAARSSGVETLCYDCDVTRSTVSIRGPLEMDSLEIDV